MATTGNEYGSGDMLESFVLEDGRFVLEARNKDVDRYVVTFSIEVEVYADSRVSALEVAREILEDQDYRGDFGISSLDEKVEISTRANEYLSPLEVGIDGRRFEVDYSSMFAWETATDRRVFSIGREIGGAR